MSDRIIEKKILELLELENGDLKKLGIDLEAYVNDELNSKKIENILDELIDELRTYYIKNDSKMYPFSDEIDSEIANKINDVVKKTLVIYDSFAIVRNMELQEADKLLDEIFENCILRCDLEYINKEIEAYSEVDVPKLKQFISAFRSMIYDCVSKLLNENSIKRSLEVNTDLNSILVNSVVQNINSNFFELKLNYLVNGMRNQMDK